LKLFEEILRGDEVSGTFDSQSILRSVLDACQGHVTTVYKKLAKLNSTNKATVLMGKIAWPFHKDECQQCSRALHEYTLTLQVLVMTSNRSVSEPILLPGNLLMFLSSLLQQSFSAVLSKLEQQHEKAMGSIEMLRESFMEIPEGMQQIWDRLTTVITDLARSSNKEIKRISEKVEKLDIRSKGQFAKFGKIVIAVEVQPSYLVYPLLRDGTAALLSPFYLRLPPHFPCESYNDWLLTLHRRGTRKDYTEHLAVGASQETLRYQMETARKHR
jgi:hypothetical protein